MRLLITGKNIEVSDYLKTMIAKKSKKLERYLKPETEMNVTLSVEKNRHIAEVTILFDGVVLRAEEVTGDMYASIDNALEKLERQIHRHRTKLEKKLRYEAFDGQEAFGGDEFERKIVRTKSFDIKPMDIEEAEMQLELLGHSFFVFTNSRTNQVNVLYVRKDGHYGLIEPHY